MFWRQVLPHAALRESSGAEHVKKYPLALVKCYQYSLCHTGSMQCTKHIGHYKNMHPTKRCNITGSTKSPLKNVKPACLSLIQAVLSAGGSSFKFLWGSGENRSQCCRRLLYYDQEEVNGGSRFPRCTALHLFCGFALHTFPIGRKMTTSNWMLSLSAMRYPYCCALLIANLSSATASRCWKSVEKEFLARSFKPYLWNTKASEVA